MEIAGADTWSSSAARANERCVAALVKIRNCLRVTCRIAYLSKSNAGVK
jgi:hypothetical protein